HFSFFKRTVILFLCLCGILFAAPNLFYQKVETANDLRALQEIGAPLTAAQQADLKGWPEFLPSALVNLGLDLRGGAHLLVEVAVEDVYASRLDAMWPEVRDALRDLRDDIGSLRRQESAPDELRVRIADLNGMPKALEAIRDLSRPVVSLTGAGSSDFEVAQDGSDIVLSLSEAEKIATDDRTMEQSLEIIRRRVDEAGTREPTIQRQGADRILVQVPGIGSAEELLKLIGKTAKLTFNPVITQTTNPDQRVQPDEIVLPDAESPDLYYILDRSAVVSGDELTDSQPAFDQNGRPSVTFRFDASGGRKFGQYTAEHIGEPFAIVLDNEVISAPVIQGHIVG
ncbi:MAG TPA: protein translocase subunit SecD, partial [Paracoccaceae bacterium]|nr:protein translocase subunit SecD [Paracoccaceae bacterium]